MTELDRAIRRAHCARWTPQHSQVLEIPRQKPVWQTPTLIETINRYDNPVEKIMRVVANAYGVETVSLFGPRRIKALVKPRHLAMYLCRYVLKMSYPAISKRFHRDHSSVIFGCKRIDVLRAQDLEFEFFVSKLVGDLSSS